ncbi:hypothetical protein [Spirosoma koreense]
MNIPTIQDIMTKASKYRNQGLSQERAIQLAIASFPLAGRKPASNRMALVTVPVDNVRF